MTNSNPAKPVTPLSIMKDAYISRTHKVEKILYTCFGQTAIETARLPGAPLEIEPDNIYAPTHEQDTQIIFASHGGTPLFHLVGEVTDRGIITIETLTINEKIFDRFAIEDEELVNERKEGFIADILLAILDSGYGLVDQESDPIVNAAWKRLPSDRAFARGYGYVGITQEARQRAA